MQAATCVFLMDLHSEVLTVVRDFPHHPQPKNVSKHMCHFQTSSDLFKNILGHCYGMIFVPPKDMFKF